MIIFPHLRTRRIAVHLRELTAREAIGIAKLPLERYAAADTEFLRCAAAKADRPLPSFITDPRLWTVEERKLVVCHYLSAVSPDGADFAVGNGHLSDYVEFDKDLERDVVPLGDVGEHSWHMRPLLGLHEEVLEQVCTGVGEWTLGMLACQVHTVDPPDYLTMPATKLREWVEGRIAALNDLPESDLAALRRAADKARSAIEHFFNIGAGKDGVLCWPWEEKEAGSLGPARFRARTCISTWIAKLFGGVAGAGGGAGDQRPDAAAAGAGLPAQ